MLSFLRSLELDRSQLYGKFITVHEEHGGDASFALSSFITEFLGDRDASVLVVALHHNFEHYFHTCLRLGMNLNNHKDRIEFVEPDAVKLCQLETFNEADDFKNLLNVLKNNINRLERQKGKVCLVVDCLTDLLVLSDDAKTVKIFIHYLYTLLKDNLCIIVLNQYAQGDRAEISVKTHLEMSSHLNLYVSPLKTGFSKKVSGSMRLEARGDSNQLNTKFYHYRLTDKQIKIFSPGNIS